MKIDMARGRAAVGMMIGIFSVLYGGLLAASTGVPLHTLSASLAAVVGGTLCFAWSYAD